MPERRLRLGLPLDRDVAEVVTRGRQGMLKWLERAGGARAGGAPLGRRASLIAATGSRGSRRSFPGAVDDDLPAVLEARFPGIAERTAAEADRIRSGRFDLLGLRDVFLGEPVDWRRDPVSGRRAPLTHWSRIDPERADVVGDVKLVWELNRHAWMVTLARAFRLTADERYAEAACARWRDWSRANPPGLGINWTSSLEVAIRLIAWCWSFALLRRSTSFSPPLRARMVEGIRAHATHVERYLSYYFSPNTHLTGEALGLVYAGTLFPDLPSATRWRGLGTSVLVNESVRQVYDDGVYFEQSTGYQRYTVDIFLHLLVLAGIGGDVVQSGVRETVERMVEVLIALRSPGGFVPQIGDDDGGSLLPLARREPGDLRGSFSVAAALFGRADFAWAAGGPAPETAWLLGAPGLARLDALRPEPPSGPPSRAFPRGGYVVMRSGWDARAHQLIFDVGPLGCPSTGAHGHADLLSIQCSAFGEPYVVDPGTYCYGAAAAWRDQFRGTGAHSTVLVDGVGQAVPRGTFAWESRPAARLVAWRSTAAHDFAAASHDAYHRLAGRVTHRRRVLFARRRFFVVVDDLEGAGEHDVEVRFQLAPLVAATRRGPWIIAAHPAGHRLLLSAFASRPLRPSLAAGRDGTYLGWYSPRFGQRAPAPLARWRVSAPLPVRVVSLLLPVEDRATPPPRVRPIRREGRPLGGLDLGPGWGVVLVDDRDVAIEGS